MTHRKGPAVHGAPPKISRSQAADQAQGNRPDRPAEAPAGRFAWEHAIRDDPAVTRNRLVVLLALATFADRDGRVTVGAARLSAVTGLSVSTVREHLTGARQDGLLERVTRGHHLSGGRAAASTYLLTQPPAARQLEDKPTAGESAVGGEPTAENTTPNRRLAGTQPPAGRQLPYLSKSYASTRAGARESPPPCGHCDARPDDHPAARVVYDANDRPHPCPRCHPSTRSTPPEEKATA